MATCPKGHESTATDYCDECGTPMGGVATGPDGPLAAEAATPAGTGDPCPECDTSRTGRFCEVCGHDFLAAQLAERPPAGGSPAAELDPNGEVATPAPPLGNAGSKPSTATGWRVVVTADRAYYDRMRAAADPDAEDVAFPAYCPERRFALVPPQVLIGRLSRSRGIEPDIDLTGPPADPAVSHSHAVLVVQPDRIVPLAKAIDRADLLTDQRFADPAALAANRGELAAILAGVFGAQPMAHWAELLTGINVTFGVVSGAEEVAKDPQLTANDIVVPLEGAGTLTQTISSPIQVHGVAKVPARRGPGLGEHNDEVLAELGFDARSIADLRASGAVPGMEKRAA